MTLLGAHLNETLAYLDAGTCSLVIQTVIAGAVTAGFFIKTRWASIVSSFKKNQNQNS